MTRNQTLVAIVVLIAALTVFGVILDHSIPESTTPLFAGFMAASLLGVVLGGVGFGKRLGSRRNVVVFSVCLCLVWRLTYFPFMVLAGTGAAYAESVAIWCGVRPLVFAPFLMLLAALHAVTAWLTGLPVVLRLRLVWLPFGLALLPAATVSLSQPVDLHPLPDRCWHRVPDDITVSKPVANPYLPALKRPEYRIHQRVLLLAAGLTYDLIPGSPWSRSVKGTLEDSFLENPFGSTGDRVLEHYSGYLAAHPHIGETPAERNSESKSRN